MSMLFSTRPWRTINRFGLRLALNMMLVLTIASATPSRLQALPTNLDQNPFAALLSLDQAISKCSSDLFFQSKPGRDADLRCVRRNINNNYCDIDKQRIEVGLTLVFTTDSLTPLRRYAAKYISELSNCKNYKGEFLILDPDTLGKRCGMSGSIFLAKAFEQQPALSAKMSAFMDSETPRMEDSYIQQCGYNASVASRTVSGFIHMDGPDISWLTVAAEFGLTALYLYPEAATYTFFSRHDFVRN